MKTISKFILQQGKTVLALPKLVQYLCIVQENGQLVLYVLLDSTAQRYPTVIEVVSEYEYLSDAPRLFIGNGFFWGKNVFAFVEFGAETANFLVGDFAVKQREDFDKSSQTIHPTIGTDESILEQAKNLIKTANLNRPFLTCTSEENTISAKFETFGHAQRFYDDLLKLIRLDAGKT